MSQVPTVWTLGDKPTSAEFNENFAYLCELIDGLPVNPEVLDAVNDVIDAIGTDVATLQAQVATLNAKCEGLEADLSEVQEKCDDAVTRIEAIEEELDL